MPYFPDLTVPETSSILTSRFLGLDRSPKTTDGAFAEMVNMTDMDYPLLSTRRKRGVAQVLENPQGILAKDALAVVDGADLYFGGVKVNGVVLSTEEGMCPKRMVSMGAYLCIWPDKVYVNTQALGTDVGHMDASYTTADGIAVSYTMCRADGTDYDTTSIDVSLSAPEKPSNGQLWVDTTESTHVLKQYSTASGEWVQVATTFIKIASTGIGSIFSQYDGVKLSGCAADDPVEASEDAPASQADGTENALTDKVMAQVEALNGDQIIYQCGDDYIVVAGFVDQTVEAFAKPVTVKRPVPDCDFITESNNRLWGCKYGLVDGAVVNEIYASKLGDFKNWYCYLGLSTDSYTVTVGTDGAFTGAATLSSGTPVFFKEDCLHKVSGTSPSAFQMYTTMGRGVQKGSEGSLCMVDDALYYKSRDAVCKYDGSTPTSVSAALGSGYYRNAVGGTIGSRYYISMQDASGDWALYVYNTVMGIWSREDDLQVTAFARMDDELYSISASTGGLVALLGTVGTLEQDFTWSAATGVYGYDYAMQKYLSRFNLRLRLDPGAEIKLEIQYDSDGVWHDEGTARGTGVVRTVMFPVIPRRCDHCQLRLSGKGGMKLYSIARILEAGGDG